MDDFITGQEEETLEDWNPDDADQSEIVGEDDWELDSSLDHEWDAAEAKTGFTDIPPGEYQVIIEKVGKKTAQSGNKMLNYTMSICEGEFKGQKIFKNHVFTSPKSLPFIKGDFSILGVALNPPLSKSIPAAMEQLKGIIVRVKVRKQKGGDGINVDFKERLGREVVES